MFDRKMHFFKSVIVAGAATWTAASAVASTKPNILFILTDDQDWHMESIVGRQPIYDSEEEYSGLMREIATYASSTKVHTQRGHSVQQSLLHRCALLPITRHAVDGKSGP